MHAKKLHILAVHMALLNISKNLPVRIKICNKNELLRVMHRNAVASMHITCHSCM